MTPILLVGGGGHCLSCMDVIEAEGRFSIRGVVSKRAEIQPHDVAGYAVIGIDDNLSQLLSKDTSALITVGQIKVPHVRQRLFKLAVEAGATFPVIASPNAYVSHRAEISEGTIVMHFATVNAGAKVGKNCIINNHALVEHDAVISSHCHIATGARVNGGVKMGEGVFIGSGAVLKEGIRVADGAVIGAGQVVLNDVKAGEVVRRQS